jgi:hypothetical protein
MKNWDDLHRDEQIRLLIEYGNYQDQLPPICSMDSKEIRLRDWLAEQNVEYAVGDKRGN